MLASCFSTDRAVSRTLQKGATAAHALVAFVCRETFYVAHSARV